MFAVATAGLLVNLLSFWVLSRGDRGNLNLRAALLHVLGDLLGSAGAILAALVIVATGWTPVDPILSVVVSVLILRAGWRVVRESAHILLEGDARRVRRRRRSPPISPRSRASSPSATSTPGRSARAGRW